MKSIRKIMLSVIPSVNWTLLLSIVYTLFASQIQIFTEHPIPDEQFYIKSLLLIIPVTVLTLTIRKTKYLWQYLLVAIILIAGVHIGIASWIFTIITAALCFTRLVSRLSREENVLDSVSGFMIAALVAIFVMTGFMGEAYIQRVTMYHLIFVALFSFSYWGMQRFEEYIKIRESRANVPAGKILDTGSKIFMLTILVVLMILLPLMEYKYEFVPFSLPQFDHEITTEYEEEIQKQEEEQREGNGQGDMFPDVEPNPYLAMFWEILSDLMVIAVYIGFVYAFIKGVRAMIRNYKAPQIEKGDIVESTFIQVDTEVATMKKRGRLEELFDFSKEMSIRRKYKKALNKFHPKVWQTPSEMEEMAELTIPQLHEMYEEVRYGKLQ